MRCGWIAIVVLAGCYRTNDLACNARCDGEMICPDGLTCAAPGGLCSAPGQGCSVPDDAGGDAPVDLTCNDGIVHGRGPLRICLPNSVTPERITLDSDIATGSLACTFVHASPNGNLCVIAGTVIDLENPIVATGVRPLVLLGLERITLKNSSILDVSSRAEPGREQTGAGAVDLITNCSDVGDGEDNSLGGGGGAGGRAFGSAGDGGASTPPGGVGGIASTADLAGEGESFRAGCRGGRGGRTMPGLEGTGGPAGGAVYLISDNLIEIVDSSTINASGAGGGIAGNFSGGGGGGSGGYIGLDAPTIDLDAGSGSGAILFALGGGGASGCSNGGQQGFEGEDPFGPAFPAPARVNTQCGGDGGAGSTGTIGGSDGTQDMCGGGGGGGGDGVIVIVTANPVAPGLFAPTPIKMVPQ